MKIKDVFKLYLIVSFFILGNTLNAQRQINQTKWVNLGFGKAKLLHQFDGINFSMNVNGKFVPFLVQQVGLNSTFPLELFGSSPNIHSFLHVNIGSGWSTRIFMLTGFVGPAFVVHKNKDQNNDFKSDVGLNANMQLLLKLSTHYGIGLEGFKMLSHVGSSAGIKVILHVSNGLE